MANNNKDHKYYYIYKIVNLVNKKCYVSQASDPGCKRKDLPWWPKSLQIAQMAEMVDALDQGSSAKRFGGSSPPLGTNRL